MVGSAMAVGIELYGWPESVFDEYSLGISIVAWVIALASLLLLFRFLDRVPRAEIADVPPPPQFGDDR
ncbi:MAG: hypothetical protein ACK4S4_02565 [Pyrinomonadaceae bacterium]